MAYDIVNEKYKGAGVASKKTRFTDATATTAFTDAGLGAPGISFIRAVIYATAASAATFSLEVADDSGGTNPIVVSIVTPATSVASCYDLEGLVPVTGKKFYRVVRGGTSATFDAFVEVT